MIKEIPKSDIVTRPIKVYKEWTLDENDVHPIFGLNDSGSFIDVDSDEKSQGINRMVFYASINAQFYNNASTASILYEVGKRKSYASTDERNLENELAVIAIPQIYFGEGIKVGSVVLKDETTNKTYTDDKYSNLTDTTGSIVGNIFYDRGLVVLTKNVSSGSVLNQFTLDYRSIKTIYENEIFLSVLENEFNVSQNPSAVYEDDGYVYDHYVTDKYDATGNTLNEIGIYEAGTQYIRGAEYPYISELDSNKVGSFDDYFVSGALDPTGSYLAPYITTIALYDDELNMVAVAKLPRPIKSLPDYPLNFIVRLDS